jgi:hypothetical protein
MVPAPDRTDAVATGRNGHAKGGAPLRQKVV